MGKAIKQQPLTDDEIDTLTSNADGEYKIRRSRKVGLYELKELALDENVEKCPTCYWWVESGELIPDGSDETDRHCLNCRPPDNL